MTNNENSKQVKQSDSCCKKVEVPSEDELEALNAMRAIKTRVRDLKKRLSELSSPNEDEKGEEASALKKEMAKLKSDWDVWEKKRKKAAKERMILLGHEEMGKWIDD